MSGNNAHPIFGDTGAANLQKVCELGSFTSEKYVLFSRHIVKVICILCSGSFLCSKEINVFTGN
jgi:hypothetical protein